MATITEVGVTSGVPTSGTGTASTLDGLMAAGLIAKQATAANLQVQAFQTTAANLQVQAFQTTATNFNALVTIATGGALNPNGQVTMATSAPVVLASDQGFATASRFPMGPIRVQKGVNVVTIATTTETVIATAITSTFIDIYGLILANTSATATTFLVKDVTAGTLKAEFILPAGDTRGIALNSGDALTMATAGNNWTGTLGTSVSGVVVTVLYVKN